MLVFMSLRSLWAERSWWRFLPEVEDKACPLARGLANSGIRRCFSHKILRHPLSSSRIFGCKIVIYEAPTSHHTRRMPSAFEDNSASRAYADVGQTLDHQSILPRRVGS